MFRLIKVVRFAFVEKTISDRPIKRKNLIIKAIKFNKSFDEG